jgi:hypothetical protein
MKTIVVVAAALALLASSALADTKPAQLRTFSAAADFHEGSPDQALAAEVLRYGPFRLFLECRHSGTDDVAELIITSEDDGWVATVQPFPPQPLSAGDTLVLLSGNWPLGTPLGYGGPAPLPPGQTQGVSAMAATGEVLNVPADTVAFGTDGERCFATGAIIRNRCRECGVP